MEILILDILILLHLYIAFIILYNTNIININNYNIIIENQEKSFLFIMQGTYIIT